MMTVKQSANIPLVAAAAVVAGLSLANAPAGRYSASNGMVTDNRTGLVWQQAVTDSTMFSYTWDTAKTHCSSLNLNGTGWRLPTAKELATLVDLSQTNAPYIDRVAFPSSSTFLHWTSTPHVTSSSSAWAIDFSLNYGMTTGISKGQKFNARCVR